MILLIKKIILPCLFMQVSIFMATAQILITGTVSDNSGDLVPGVNVTVKGTTTGVTTGSNGKYSIIVPSEDAVLVFSFMGYVTQELSVGNQQSINVKLVEDTRLIDEVVVIGYGTVQKRDLTTAVSTVSTKDINERPVISAAAALQGKSSGVQVIQPNGTPGAGFTVRIRGNSSINAGNDPLYIVDGIPLNDINHISPNDIESMQILKDASSAAIYGSRAANGVVLITTKKGKAGEAKITFNSYFGISKVGRHMDALNTEQYREYLKEIGMGNIPDNVTNYTNWFNETFRTGMNQNYMMSFSSGTDKMQYYLSGGYTSDKGIVPNSSYNRYSFRSNIENQIRKWIKLGSNLSYSYTQSRTVPNNIGSNRAGVILAVINTAPYLHIWNPENPEQYDNNAYGTRIEPPLAFTSRYTDMLNSRLLGDVNAEITIFPTLKFKSSLSIDLNTYNSYWFLDPVKTEYGRQTHGQSQDDRTISRNIQFENILTYDRRIEKHSLNVMGGFTTNSARWSTSSISGSDFISSAIQTLNAANIISQGSWTGRFGWNILSFLGRVSYNYDSRYLLSANFRADGSSKLAPDRRWGYFPSLSAAWRISGEHFMKDVTAINDLKIRVGWGQTGNQGGISEYSYLQQYTIGKQTPTADNPFPGITLSKSNIKNSELTWETTTQTNAGIDLSLFNSRLTFNADVYYKHTRNLLLNVPLPATATASSILRNEGEMINKGLEITVSSKNFTSNFKWNTDFNISFNRNRLTNLELAQVYYFGNIETLRDNVVRLENGYPLGSFYGLKYKYVDPETGDMIYDDLNGDGKITPEDRTYIGNAYPKFIFGLNNDFSYKNFTLNIFLQGSYGNNIFNASKADTQGMYDDKNQSVEVLKRWVRPGQITNIPRATGDQSTLKASSYYIEDGSYIRIKNVTLGYNLESKKLKSIGIYKIQPYFTAQNLLTFTKYSGFDPELNFAGNSSVVQGVDWGTYPNVKSFVFGLNVEF